jgi:nucleoside 2-deoxyribosyltransferase
MRPRPSAYLAGPDVFLRDAAALGERKKRLCAAYGIEGLFPLDETLDDDGAPLDARIYRACVAMLRRADMVIAHLTPFRGPGADAGTVFELGMAVGLGKPVFGYTNDGADLLQRVLRGGGAQFDPTATAWRDADGLEIENFGNADNLMIDQALAQSGAPLVRHAAAPDNRFHDLAGFEACLRLAAARFTVSAN